MFESENIKLLNVDCMEYMAGLPDKAFDLAIVDPPYGIGEDGLKNHSRWSCAKPRLYTPKQWDRETVTAKYISELRRVAKHQIIWGANHFISKIALDSPSWVVWDKQNGGNDFADCELAWTSFSCAVRQFTFRWAGMLQGNMNNKEYRIHPTQKPVQLYKWLLKNYAKPGDRILDTHLGSGSSAIAAFDFKAREFVGCEIDKDYYNAAVKRFKVHALQYQMF